MARAPYQPVAIQEQLQPQAAPVDTYVRPGPSNLEQFAQSLRPFSQELTTFLDARAKKASEEDELRGRKAWFGENSASIAEAVRSGKVPPQYSPAFMRGFKNSQGEVAGASLQSQFLNDWNAWEGKNSDDPEAFNKWSQEWLAQKIQTDDPDVLRGLLPSVRQIVDGGFALNQKYTADRVYNGALNAGLAGANQIIDEGTQEGLSKPGGTDYAAVFSGMAEKRKAFVANGGKPEDFDKSMIDAMANKIITTRDPGLLGWFDQKVPGQDYTYGESAYGAKIKQDTLETLEVRYRQHESEAYTKQNREDEKQKDNTQREAIEILMQDPNAPIPQDLVERGMKYDPQFMVKASEWRKNLATGFTDPKKLQAVYQDIVMNGKGMQAVKEAAEAGVFGKAEDLSAMYNFAKSYEENGDRISKVLGMTSAKNITAELQRRTQGVDDLGQPLPGWSDAGLEASFDFNRMVSDWVINNPNANSLEVENFINQAGKTVLERTQRGEIMEEGTYTRPTDQTTQFDNPFSETAAQQDVNAQPVGSAPSVADLWFNKLGEDQKNALEAKAKSSGIPLEELKKTMAAQAAPNFTFDENNPDLGENDQRERGFSVEEAESFLSQAIQQSSAVTLSEGGVGTAGALKELIGKHESNGNYNAVYGNSRSTVNLSNFTINDILGQQQYARARGAKSTAIGKYQFIYKTLKGLRNELGLSGNEKFTPQMQERLADQLLKRRGIDRFLSGRMSQRQFALNLSQEWASLPDPRTGRSFYAGDGLNAAGVSVGSVYKALGFALNTPVTQPVATVTPGGQPQPSFAGTVSPAYANIPDVDGNGKAGQQAKFMQWNSDPVGNHEKNLQSVDSNLANVVRRAQQLTGQQFVVGSGKRDAALQKKAKEWGWSKTEDSDHLHGNALDLWPLDDNGAVVFEPKRQRAIMKAMKQAAKELGVELDVGGDWKSFKDLPHFAVKKGKKGSSKAAQDTETFSNGKRYRGIAREDSPLGEASKRNKGK